MVELGIGRLLDVSEAGEGKHKSVSYFTFCIELSPQIDEAMLLLGAVCSILFTLQECSLCAGWYAQWLEHLLALHTKGYNQGHIPRL